MFKIIVIIFLSFFLLRAILRALVAYILLRAIRPKQPPQDNSRISDLYQCKACGQYIPAGDKCDCKK